MMQTLKMTMAMMNKDVEKNNKEKECGKENNKEYEEEEAAAATADDNVAPKVSV